MKYFIDFEATQFSNEIIEIGCIREDGAKFKSYVNAENKLTKFIINLTGITQEVIDNAPSSDTVFSFFYRWLQEDNSNIEFYCYGNSDIDFVKKNLQKTKNFEAQAALSMIGMALNDYSQFVKKHFGLIKPIGLVKVLAYYRGVESIEQTHDALDDAIFLKELFNFIEAEGECSECPFPEYQESKKVVKSIVNQNIPNSPCIVRLHKNVVIETYYSMNEAVSWVYKELSRIHSQEQLQGMKGEKIAGRIRTANSTQKKYVNYKWKIFGGNNEINTISTDFVFPTLEEKGENK
jgi:inhibitor of KinA sporulation pathway (predicted exonuclease)